MALIPLRFATLRVRGRFGGGSVQSSRDCNRLVDSGAINISRGTLGDVVLERTFLCSGGSTLHGLHS